MAIFTPRLIAPLETDRYWLHYSKGGFNTAIMMDQLGSVLPNCVGYAQGRFREICMDTKVWSLIGNSFAGNAETFFASAQKAGIPTGQTPKLGAIVVWEGKGSAAGHVAIVEQIKANGDIVTSNSAYKGTRFYLKELKKSDGYLYVKDGSRPLLGFIYQALEFEEAKPQPTGSIVAGKAVILNNTQAFASESVKNAYMVKSGTYYLWDNVVKSGRIRITNAPSKVGVAGQVTCWINAADVGLTTTTSATYKQGTKCELVNVPVYSSESGQTIGKRSGIYYIWDSIVKNGRIRMTNSAARVGVAGQVSFWIDAINAK